MTDLKASLHEMLLAVEAIQNQINALRDDAMDVLRMLNATDQPAPKRLEVEWLSQLGPTAAYAPGDCGAACLAMLVNYRGTAHPTVDEVSRIYDPLQIGQSARYAIQRIHFQVIVQHRRPPMLRLIPR